MTFIIKSICHTILLLALRACLYMFNWADPKGYTTITLIIITVFIDFIVLKILSRYPMGFDEMTYINLLIGSELGFIICTLTLIISGIAVEALGDQKRIIMLTLLFFMAGLTVQVNILRLFKIDKKSR